MLDKLAAYLRPGTVARDQPESRREGEDGSPKIDYVWQMLSLPGGTHLQVLKQNYVPLGLIDMITDEPRLLLDVGCYCGTTGRLIKERWPNSVVVGIEPLIEAAKQAALNIDRVINTTFEAAKLEDNGLHPRTFDVIIFADVLEHMYNPWAALQAARELLTDDGVVLASIPNVRNLGLIHNLIEGRWKYEAAGLLDITHIRFFTLMEIHELFAQTGFDIVDVSRNMDPTLVQLWNLGAEQEFVDVQLGRLAINGVTQADRKELATLQHFVKARKAGLNGQAQHSAVRV